MLTNNIPSFHLKKLVQVEIFDLSKFFFKQFFFIYKGKQLKRFLSCY